jgi:glutathione S-transferase
MSQIFVYASELSPFGARVRIAVAARKLDIGFVPPPPERRSPERFAINPLARFPVLVDGDTRIVESMAILEYLEDRFDVAPALRPEDIYHRALGRSIVSAFDSAVFPLLTPIFPQLLTPNPDVAIVSTALQAAMQSWREVAGLFGTEGLAQGSALTLADCAMAPFVTLTAVLADRFKLPPPLSTGDRLHDWATAIAEIQVCLDAAERIRVTFAKLYANPPEMK